MAFDVIIVGAGMAGLGAGIYLQRINPKLKTLIVEQHTIPGGYVTGFKRKGYYFDGGAEGMGGMGSNQKTSEPLKKLGFEHEFKLIDPLDVYYFEDKVFSLYSDREQLISEVQKKFPEDLAGFKEFLDVCDQLATDNEQGKDVSKFMKISYLDFISEYIKSQCIIDAFNLFSLWFGATPKKFPALLAAICVSRYLLRGVYYPKNGMQAFSNHLAEFYIDNGGEIKYKSLVTKIKIEEKIATGIELADGEFIPCKWLINTADLKRTFLNYIDKKFVPNEYYEFISNIKPSITGVMIHLGVDMDLSKYPSHFQIGNGLNMVANVEKGNFDMSKIVVRIAENIEPALKNGNKSALVSFLFAPYDWNDYWKAGKNKDKKAEYKKYKDEIAEKFLTKIETIIPNIREKVEVCEVATPHTFERYVQVTNGAWYGPYRFQRLPESQTPISNLLLAGSNIIGSGAPSALRSGMNVAKNLLEKMS